MGRSSQPVLFCVDIGYLLCMLAQSNVGCYVGHLKCSSECWLMLMTLFCWPQLLAQRVRCCEYVTRNLLVIYEYSLTARSVSVLYVKLRGRRKFLSPTVMLPLLCVDCGPVCEVVDGWPHLTHVIRSDLDATADLIRCHNKLVTQVNICVLLMSWCNCQN